MGKKDKSIGLQLLVDGTREDLDERTLSMIEKKSSVKFYAADFMGPTSVSIVSLIIGLPLFGLAASVAYVMATRDQDLGSMIFYIILIAACLLGCWLCMAWYLRTKKRTQRRRAGNLPDGIYVGYNFIIFYLDDRHIHVIPKEAFVSVQKATVLSDGPSPNRILPVFAIKDANGDIHWYLYKNPMFMTEKPFDFMALMEKWGVPFHDEGIVIDEEDNYYCIAF